MEHRESKLPEGKKWKLVWADEFDGDTLDMTKWSFRHHLFHRHFPAYTEEGVYVKDGCLHIGIVEKDGEYYSAQLQTGENFHDRPSGNPDWVIAPFSKPKFMHRYGYYEARVKFQKRPFWWSAFWIQSPNTGSTSDPATSGVECDIIENFGDGQLTSGCIYGGYGKGLTNEARIHYPYVEDGEYHRIGMEWSPDGYVYYFDGKETARTTGPVSHTDQYVLLTTEIKGYRHGITPTWTDADLADCFVADYVRVFDAIEK